MSGGEGNRLVRLKCLYWYTILGAGGAGLWLLISPGSFAAGLGMPHQDAFVLGVTGSVWLAFGLVAALGLRAPVAFAPIFLVQLAYKVLWLAVVLVPRLAREAPPPYAWLFAAIFASYVVFDLIAIPFGRLWPERRGSQ